jgi:hypothetical protein
MELRDLQVSKVRRRRNGIRREVVRVFFLGFLLDLGLTFFVDPGRSAIWIRTSLNTLFLAGYNFTGITSNYIQRHSDFMYVHLQKHCSDYRNIPFPPKAQIPDLLSQLSRSGRKPTPILHPWQLQLLRSTSRTWLRFETSNVLIAAGGEEFKEHGVRGSIVPADCSRG